MGLFGGSTTTTTNESFNSGPSKWQEGYLNTAFNGAEDIYNSQKGSAYYQGETYAGMSEEQKAALAKLRDYAGTNGLSAANQLGAVGSALAGSAGKATDAMDRYMAMAGEDATASNIEAATKYADNPYVASMIDANTRDVSRTLNEQTLPGIDRQASATGNLNSSRAGVAAGIARRGAEDRIADISATIRGNAYSQGLNLAQTDRANTLSAIGNAASGYLSQASTGLGALSAGNDAAYKAFDAVNSGYDQERADAQGKLDADFNKWKGEDSRESDLLSRYAEIVAGNQWGQSGTSTSKSKSKTTQSLLSGIAGAASTAAGIYTGMK